MNLSSATLNKMYLHHVGNKLHEEGVVLSKKQVALTSGLREKLTSFFLNKFRNSHEMFSFSHPSSLKYNEVYNFCKEIFSGEMTLQAGASQIANHLYEKSLHPKIAGGELYICEFSHCNIENVATNAIGIFKTEKKSAFFEVSAEREESTVEFREGVDFDKLDKGCIVFDRHVRDGFLVSIIDSQSKGEVAQYWKEEFLQVRERADEFHYTKNFLSAAKEFIIEQLPENFEVSKADQSDLLNKSINFFKENKEFDVRKFQNEVFEDAEMAKSFQQFGSRYLEENEIEIADRFDISLPAVRKQSKVFKSVIRLDKNFHIYIHGDRSLIEQGFDKGTGKKYYKIYFDEET